MRQVVYLSAARTLLSETELAEILIVARSRNEKLGVTGLLLYCEGDFLQVLEGPDTAVAELIASIQRDPRHTRLMILVDKRIEQRQFEEWSMGFRNLSRRELCQTPGFVDYSKGGVIEPGAAASLIYSFRRSHSRSVAHIPADIET